MTSVPPVRYARSGDVSIAYCRWGEGPDVVVYTPPLVSNVELYWDLPEWERALRHGGANTEVVMLDKRGVGLSDRVSRPPTLADRVADTLAVVEAEGLGPVHLVGHSEGGPIAVAIAAQHPDLVRSLVLLGSPAQGAPADVLAALADPQHPLPSATEQAETYRSLVRHWGSETSINLELFAPDCAHDPRIRRWYQRFERQSASPGTVLAFLRSIEDLDVTGFLGAIDVPTFVIHASGDRIVHPAHGRFLADAIAGARYLEYPGDDHIVWLSPDWRPVHDELITFVTGRPPRARVEHSFATVVFTDLVDSTAREAAVGDRRWRHLLDTHDRLTRDLVNTSGGRIVKHTGDGMLAIFADPSDAVAAAVQLSEQLARVGLPVRVGIHAGQVELRDDGDVTGLTVNLAARVQGRAAADEVLVSRTVRDLLLGTSHTFEERGTYELKGIAGTWEVYAAAC